MTGLEKNVLDRLGILTDEVSPKLDEALVWIQQRNFKHVEIRMVDGANVMSLDDRQLAQVRAKVEAHGLYISTIASPVFKCPLDPARDVMQGDTFGQSAQEDVESHFRLLKRAFDIADLLGASSIRIFSFWREQEPARYEQEITRHLQRAAHEADKRGKLLLLENEPSCNGGHAAEIGRLAELTASPALKVLWDPGNEAYTGLTAFPDGYEQLKHVLAHVHLKDAIYRDGAGSCVPIGRGSVDFAGQLQALRQDGYTGLFTIETHYVPEGGTQAEGSGQSLEGLLKIIG